MAYIVMAYTVMTYTVMAYIVMAPRRLAVGMRRKVAKNPQRGRTGAPAITAACAHARVPGHIRGGAVRGSAVAAPAIGCP